MSPLPCKLEMLVRHLLPLGCYRKKLQNLFHPNYDPQNLQDLNPVDYSMWKHCNGRCTKYASLI